MPELPGPPADYSDEQQRAWRAGAATVARILSQQGSIIADAYAPEESDERDGCPECGGDLVAAFGGAVCPDCNYQEDD